MKILLLATHLNLGGIGIYTTSLARQLKFMGKEVIIASSGGELVREIEKEGITHIHIPINTSADIGLHTLVSCLKLLPVVRNKQIDIIHAQTRVTQIIASMLSRKTKAVFITTCHGFFKRRLFRRMLPCWGTRTIAISDAVRQHLVYDFKLPKERISVVCNGIETDRFNRLVSFEDKLHIKKEYGLSNLPVIGIVSRLSGVKGHKYLLGAFASLIKKMPNIQLLIIGDGPRKYREMLKDQAEILGITRSVKFHAACRDTSIPLSIIDVFCHPSLQEGLGLSILEAMAMRIPVVASDVGGIYTLIQHKSNGLLVPPKNEEALSSAIYEILCDKKKAKEMGNISRKIVEEKFTVKMMTDGILNVYEEAIKQRKDSKG